jgi:tRNA (adenine57-N1/adenine58-N1)-methyltransferase catalytic subunit
VRLARFQEMASPFLTPSSYTQENQLASLHLRRDSALPTILSANATSAASTGYAEGVVTNTRFGSFPHSTLIGLPWGSQVRASLVDTGTRGRKDVGQQAGKKRKAEEVESADGEAPDFKQKEAVTASSGFIHVLPPTPENWTTSLPHRTQVVYTPDYSYILHRLRARPGSVIIEAGSGSGSFTHAAARAVFSGYPENGSGTKSMLEEPITPRKKGRKEGHVYSYEFHLERFEKVTAEMKDHGLESIVRTTHRDVYAEGFSIPANGHEGPASPVATAVFLDLPAPWQALPYLTRIDTEDRPSPLDPTKPVYICTFSPCIEQAQRTVSALRQHGWIEIETVEMQHKRIEVKREYTGLEYEGMRGVSAIAANVDQAVSRLRKVEKRARDFHTGSGDQTNGAVHERKTVPVGKLQEAKKTLFNQGTVIHKSEPELKTHTSYLVFAVLPQDWTHEDEMRARSAWKGATQIQSNAPKSQRQLKREARQKAKAEREVDIPIEEKDKIAAADVVGVD